MNSIKRILFLAKRGAINYISKRPFCVSFEVTYECNAKCKHCHLGGSIEKELRASPQKFGELARTIKPVVAQISGGEPLLRKDLEDIVGFIKVPKKDPFVVLTTNAALLSKKRYISLREAGVDEFSISFDYPDKRHDEFRSIPGLFEKIETLLSDLKEIDDKGITLSCVVHRQNYKYLIDMARFAKKWNVGMNFSTYTWLRTNKKEDFMINKDEMEDFKSRIKELIDFKRKYGTIFTSEYNFSKMINWFETQKMGGCKAGQRFLIVGPDCSLSPCGLVLKNYNDRKELLEKFTKTNSCDSCFTSIRVNSEKTISRLLKDNIRKGFGKL